MKFRTHSRSRHRRNHGFTLVETSLASIILMLVITGSMSLFSTGATLYGGTADSAYAEMSIDDAARLVRSELAAARYVVVDAGGQGVTYYRYQTDPDTGAVRVDGQYMPLPDTTARRFYRSGTDLYWTDRPSRPILRDVPVTDPASNQPLILFAPGASAGGVTVQIVTRPTYGAGNGQRTAMQRTLGYVVSRNVPTW